MEKTENSSSPAPSTSAAGGKEKIEKQARQLAYDTRYKVKQSMAANKGAKMDPAAVRKAYLGQLNKSPSSPPVKARAKEMLVGEEYINTDELVRDSAVSILHKVFVEKKGLKEECDCDCGEDPCIKCGESHHVVKEASGEKTYKVRVTDKKTNNTYVRMATRAKISELRSNPNISSVEMTGYGSPTKSEKYKGKKTAAVKAGKDYDGDGKVESPTAEYKGSKDKAIKKALRSENFDGFLELVEKKKDKKKKITGEGVNNSKLVKVFPNDNVDESLDYGSKTARQGDNEAAAAARKRIYDRASDKDKDAYDKREIAHQRNAERRKEVVAKEEVNPQDGQAGDNDPQIKSKQKRISLAKRQILLKKMQAVKAGAGSDITASHQPEGEVIEEKKSKKLYKGNPTGPSKKPEGGDRRPGVKEGADLEVKPKKKEEVEDDYRAMWTKANLVRNKLRAMGLKMSHEPEGKVIEGYQRDPEKGEAEARKADKRSAKQKRMADPKKGINSPAFKKFMADRGM